MTLPESIPASPHTDTAADTPRRALILYASQTGTSEDLSADLSDALERLHVSVSLHSFASFLPQFSTLPAHDLVFFLVSTTGQGALPDSAIPLWRRLCRKKLPGDWLANVQFGMFALGDSTYPKFCWAGRMVGRRLLQLGASECVQRVEGDANSEEGVDGAFSRWVKTVQETVRGRYSLPEGLEELLPDTLLPPKWVLEFDDHNGVESVLENEFDKMSLTRNPHVPYPGSILTKITKIDRVTAEDHWQDVRHLTFELPEPAHWDPGDILSLSPQNPSEDVDMFISLQHWEDIADRPLSIKPSSGFSPDELPPCPVPFPVRPLTLRTLLTYHLDINCVPSRRFFSLASHLTDDEMQKERLQEFTDPMWIEELWDYTTRPRRTLLEVLQEFGRISIPLDRVLELVPRLRPRQFSITNSPPHGEAGREMELLIAIVKYKTVLKKQREGVCSRWIAKLKPGDEIAVTLTKGSLGVPSEALDRPVVMVAPGTGVAPMRALIQRRHPSNVDLGTLSGDLLFFGCRNRKKDYFFAEEWEELERMGKLKVFPAFSRDQKGKVYVQTKIREHAEEVWDAIGRKEGIVVICGSSGRMPQAVREALMEVFQEKGEMGREEAKEYLKAMERSSRYLQETWS